MTIAVYHEVSFTSLAVIWSFARDVVVRRLLAIAFMMTIDLMPNYLAGVGAGRMPEIIEMMQVDVGHISGSARLSGR